MKSFRNWVKNILFLLVYLFAGGTLVLIVDGIATGSELTPFNTAIEAAISHMRTPFLTQFFVLITNLGSPFVLSCLALVLAIFLLLHRDTYNALLYLSGIFLSMAGSLVLKNIFQITRPFGGLISLSSWSFPSGHATVATAFFFATAYTFWGRIKSIYMKILLLLGCTAAAGLVAFSRLYLGAHYGLDVLAGIALGLCAVSMMILVFNIFIEEETWRLKRRSARI